MLSGRDDADIDAEFHLTLAKASRNTVLSDLLLALNDTLDESRSHRLRTPMRRRHSSEAHLRIIDALERRDPALCRSVMEEHLRIAENDAFALNENEK